MDTQAQIAKKANNLTESIQRAFITFGTPKIDPVFGSLDYWKVSLVMQNAGDTATKHLDFYPGIWHEDMTVYEKIPNLEQDNPDTKEWVIKKGDKPFRYSIGPKAQIEVGPYIIDSLTVRRIRDTKLKLYVTGFANYNDVFNDIIVHKTKVCFIIMGKMGNPGNTGLYGTERVVLPEIAELSSRPCLHNNCTDDECTEYESQPPSG